MATSSLYHAQETPPTVGKGHGTAALGPSDSTGSGSDIGGGPGPTRAATTWTASSRVIDEA